MVKIGDALVRRGARGLCWGLRSLALWPRIIRWRGGSHCPCSLARCAEVVTLTG